MIYDRGSSVVIHGNRIPAVIMITGRTALLMIEDNQFPICIINDNWSPALLMIEDNSCNYDNW